jgi:predicted DNA-binding protein (MmcQ/YjbR family)
MNIEDIRAFCLSLPHVTEDVKWGHDLCFSIGGKIFCITSLDGPLSYSFKAKDEEFDRLAAHPGLMPAPYLARYKWIHVKNDSALSLSEAQRYIQQSYRLVLDKLPGKLKKQLG